MNVSRFAYIILAAVAILAGFMLGQHAGMPGFIFKAPPPFPMDQFPNGPPSLTRGNDLNIFAAMEALNGASRKAAEEALKARFPEVKQAVDQIALKRKAVFDVVANTPADIDRLGQSLKDLREASSNAQQKSQEILLDIARSLPEGDRVAFLKAATTPRGMPPFARPR